jgi:predicted phosphodiesterase
MRVAVMSDIHGFDLALETVLADMEARGPFDEIVVAGDLCLVGPAPERVLERLGDSGYTVLCGNTDRDIVAAASSADPPAEFAYALQQIGPQGVAFLAALPFDRCVTPASGEAPRDNLLVVHANPHDLHRKITPEMTDAQVRAVLGDTRAAAIAFGHHHVPFTRVVDGTLLVDVSAVGNPKDGDLRCKYGIVEWSPQSRSWSAEIVRLDYPVDRTVAEMRGSGLPHVDAAVRTLLRATY